MSSHSFVAAAKVILVSLLLLAGSSSPDPTARGSERVGEERSGIRCPSVCLCTGVEGLFYYTNKTTNNQRITLRFDFLERRRRWEVRGRRRRRPSISSFILFLLWMNGEWGATAVVCTAQLPSLAHRHSHTQRHCCGLAWLPSSLFVCCCRGSWSSKTIIIPHERKIT